MKSFTLAAALLASAAIAQPHGHQHHDRRAQQHAHPKRELVVEIETEWVTATVIIGDGSTSTIPPTNTGGEFFEPSSTSVPVVAPTTLVPQVSPTPSPSTEAPPPPSTTSTPEPTTAAQETTTAAPVVVSSPAEAALVATPTTTTTAAAQETPASSGSSSGGGSSGGSNSATKTGDITYYALGQGACGYDDSDVDKTGHVCAISSDFWNSISTLTNAGVDQPTNPLCNKKVTLSANGKTSECTVRDKCPGCTETAIDVSEAAFLELFGSLGVGRGTVTWSLSW